MIYAIGIYKVSDKFEKIAFVPKTKSIFSGDPLAELEKDTLPNLGEIEDNRFYHYQMNGEHQFIKKVPLENTVIAITGKTKWTDVELHFLFRNINYVRMRPLAKVTLEDILKNPIGYTGKDLGVSLVQDSLDDAKNIMHANIEKVLQRGENIEKTLERSIELEKVSETFEKKSRKLNSCCR